ncbi:MAG: class I SAM-dependent methyltransferase [Oscillospiraceae bacterium]|nr:class I SAM-dependent methyltransferase [Oscillospiraceae bacterium]
MSGYGVFARYYDALTADVDYPARAAYFAGIIRNFCPGAKLVLDLACGTGSLTYAMAGLGFDMIGVDASGEMLAVGASKGGATAPLFLCQKAEELDLFGTVDACVCALDSLNHLPGENALRSAIGRVSLFLNPGGVFVFDMNTPYKHTHILANNDFVRESGNVLCAWRNRLDPETGRVDITLDFFEKTGSGLYRRSAESFSEYCYDTDKISEILREAGLETAAVYEGDTLSPPKHDTQRIVFAALRAGF